MAFEALGLIETKGLAFQQERRGAPVELGRLVDLRDEVLHRFLLRARKRLSKLTIWLFTGRAPFFPAKVRAFIDAGRCAHRVDVVALRTEASMRSCISTVSFVFRPIAQ